MGPVSSHCVGLRFRWAVSTWRLVEDGTVGGDEAAAEVGFGGAEESDFGFGGEIGVAGGGDVDGGNGVGAAEGGEERVDLRDEIGPDWAGPS